MGGDKLLSRSRKLMQSVVSFTENKELLEKVYRMEWTFY